HDFKAVAQHQHEIGIQSRDGVRHADEAQGHRANDPTGAVVVQIDPDPSVDREAIGLNLLNGHAEARLKVHPGDDKLQVKVRIIADIAHDPVEETVLGPTTCHDADSARAGHQLARRVHGDCPSEAG